MTEGVAGGEVTVVEATAREMFAIKGDLADEALRGVVQDLLGAAFPKAGQVVAGRGAVVWMAPDEILALIETGRRVEALGRFQAAAEGRHVLVEDVSDMRVGFVIEGAEVRDVLARLTPADVSSATLPVGRVRRTRVGQVAAAIWFTAEDRAELLCFRSVANYLSELIREAAASEPLGLYHVKGGG